MLKGISQRFEGFEPMNEIPPGRHSNCYFAVRDLENKKRILKKSYPDDYSSIFGNGRANKHVIALRPDGFAFLMPSAERHWITTTFIVAPCSEESAVQ